VTGLDGCFEAFVRVRYCTYSPNMSHSPAQHLIHPFRWVVFALLTLGFVLVGLPAASASAAAGGLITGTITFHETSPDRTLEVYKEASDGTFAENESLSTTIASNGTFTVHAPAGVPVKLRVSYGDKAYGYWYGDVFAADTATPVQAAAGETVGDINLQVPVPVSYSGRLLDRGGRPVAGTVTPTSNTDGASVSLVPAPIPVDATGEYHVILPAKSVSWYENGVVGTDENGDNLAWLGGGSGSEPNWYLNPQPGEVHTNENITLPVGSAQSVTPAGSQPAATTRLRAIKSPVVRGTTRKGAILRSTSGRFNCKPTTLRYQWLRNGHAIGKATASTYHLKKADVRKRISVRVTATRSGTRVLATSARTKAVRAR
jgi:hypothetical protein